MLIVLLIPITALQQDPLDQILSFNEKTAGPIGIMTTSNGAPVSYRDASGTLNTRLLYNEYFMDSITHLSRERIPERFVHAKAGGAFGYFIVTHDITHICKAKLFSTIGKITPIAARFSSIIVERGGSDTSRDARGFAVKFYTEEGNFDIVGLNTPMFVIKDPLFFTTFVHAVKKNPTTNLFDANVLWDFLTLRPESWHIFLWIFSDRGIPDGYRHMPGFGIHTFQVVNEGGENYFVRFHFLPNKGIKNLSAEEARNIGAEDADYNTRDLYKSISNGDFPAWNLSVQILSLEDVKNANFDVFDVTKILPLHTYPLHPVGQVVLNRNPVNYFAEIEQLAFNPANLVPGILGGVDKLFEARRLSYRDAQYYRLGANFNKIPVNCPLQSKSFTYNRDGVPPVKANGKDTPNYFPNSFNGPFPLKDFNSSEPIKIIEQVSDNFGQIRELYLYGMTDEERDNLIDNILYSLGSASKILQDRAVNIFSFIHSDFGNRIEQGLISNITGTFYL
ncbi:catalase-like [Zerene cesonia]|uniref:catalase-like n=1 Tax=Zerene cesonia TaxID=33412 RepID=UPI0018E510D9|nr:catalase-like [Zerene cesonia]